MPIRVNVSPVGDLFIVGIGTVKAGAEFECSDEQAEKFDEQPDNYSKPTPKKKG